MPRSVLVVDDDRLFCQALGDALAPEGIEVRSAHSTHEARALWPEQYPVVILDNHLEGDSGLSLIPELEAGGGANVILCTAHPGLDNAVEALRLKLFDYLVKPVDLGVLLGAVRRGLRAQGGAGDVDHRVVGLQRIHGSGPAMVGLRLMVKRASQVSSTVLITGETGTGKTMVARALHEEGDASGPFVHVNCAALPEGLVEAELFGAERGAFTGALQTRRGLFEQAHGGTLFLDELAELPMAAQAKLLVALEEGAVRRVGGTRSHPANVRVIAATNVDVSAALAAGRLRRDLYYRLNVVRLSLPPLREQRAELGTLIDHLLDTLPEGRGRSLASGEVTALSAYEWPGNARELRNILERALVLQPTGPLRPSLLIDEQRYAQPALLAATPCAAEATSCTEVLSLDEVEHQHILLSLDRCGGNRARTARALGVSTATLRRKLSRYNVLER